MIIVHSFILAFMPGKKGLQCRISISESHGSCDIRDISETCKKYFEKKIPVTCDKLNYSVVC